MTILLLPALAGLGFIFKKIFKYSAPEISLTILYGIFGITLLWTVIAFFLPLNIFIESLTIIIGLGSFFYFKIYLHFWQFFSKNAKFLFPVFLIILFFGSYFPFILDHFGYYVPTIKWISEVGLVKGISNLDLLLGQMSLWHIFQAGFSHFADPFLRINVLVLVVYLIYILEKKCWIHLLFLPVLFLFVQSPSPDLAVVIFSLIILNEVFLRDKNTGHLFALSIFIFAIKPTMIWVPLFVFCYSILIRKDHFKVLIFGIFVFFLFFFKNIWTFGFPVFPVQFLDLNVAWKPNSDLLQTSSEFAIRKTYDMQFEYVEIQKFSTGDYVKNWLFIKGIKGKIHVFFILSLLIFFLFSLFKKSRIIWMLFVSVLVKSVLVLWFSAQYRFLFDVFFIIVFVLFYKGFPKRLALGIFAILTIFSATFLSFPNLIKEFVPSFNLGKFMTGFTKNQLYKPATFELKKYKSHQIGNLKFNVVDGYVFSFDTPIPAISPQFIEEDLDAGIFPQLKGKTLKEGFIWRRISSEEKLQLQKIVDEFRKTP